MPNPPGTCDFGDCHEPRERHRRYCLSHDGKRDKRSCATCGKPFFMLPSAPNRYCSLPCYHQSRVKYPPVGCCRECGAQINRRSTRCMSCSRKGQPAWNKGELVKVTCEVCGTVREMWPAHAVKARTCSKECAHELKRRVTGETHPLFTRQPITCRFCGVEFLVKPSELARKFYCSRACAGSASIRKQGGRRSSLERAVAAYLDARGVAYEPQVRIHRFLVDFRIGDLIVEADGVYWHSRPEVVARDARKNAAVLTAGYRLLRLTEAEITAGDFSALDAALDEAASA